MKILFIQFKIFIFLFILVLSSCNLKSRQKDDKGSKENWIQLFNGKDLNSWQPKFKGYEAGYNLKNTFRVEDGLLRVTYDEWEKWDNEFGHLFYDGEFSHYRLRVEYRFVGEQVNGGPGWAFRNNGLMLHGQSVESMEKDQDFPVSIEVQLLGGNGSDKRSTLNVCTPGTNIVINDSLIEQHCLSSGSDTYHGDQWVTAEIEVNGEEIIRHVIDGKEVLSYEKPQLDPRDKYYNKLLPANGNKIISKGTISIQAESHPTDFRKIELLKLE
jgi:hypothetical protein